MMESGLHFKPLGRWERFVDIFETRTKTIRFLKLDSQSKWRLSVRLTNRTEVCRSGEKETMTKRSPEGFLVLLLAVAIVIPENPTHLEPATVSPYPVSYSLKSIH